MTRTLNFVISASTNNNDQMNVQQLKSNFITDTKLKMIKASNKISFRKAFGNCDEDEEDEKDEEKDIIAMRIKSEESLIQSDITKILEEYQGNKKLVDHFNKLIYNMDDFKEIRNNYEKAKKDLQEMYYK